jgi:hypothetical protein
VHLAAVVGAALLVLAYFIVFEGFDPSAHRALVNAAACGLFGVLLVLWSVSKGSTWGIGHPTVQMLAAVVAALVAIFALNQNPQATAGSLATAPTSAPVTTPQADP